MLNLSFIKCIFGLYLELCLWEGGMMIQIYYFDVRFYKNVAILIAGSSSPDISRKIALNIASK